MPDDDTRRCLACGATLTGRADQRYCDSTCRSHACRLRQAEARPARTCLYCGTGLDWPRIKFCSEAHRELYHDRRVREMIITIRRERGLDAETEPPTPAEGTRRRRRKTYLPDVASGVNAPG